MLGQLREGLKGWCVEKHAQKKIGPLSFGKSGQHVEKMGPKKALRKNGLTVLAQYEKLCHNAGHLDYMSIMCAISCHL